MASTVRSLTIATRVDASGMAAGIQQSLAEERRFAEEVKKLNAQVDEARDAYRKAKKSGVFVDETKAQYDAARKERADAIANAGLKSQLETRYLRATETQLQTQLREHETYYARLRELHQGNEVMLSQITRTAAAERARIEQNYAESGGGMSDIFRSRAGRRAIKGLIAGQVASMTSPEIGQAIGAGSMAMMMGMGAGAATGIGAVVFAANQMSSAYREAKKSAEDLRKMHEASAKAIREMNEALLDAPPTTAFGERLLKQAEIAKKRIAELEYEVYRREYEISSQVVAWMTPEWKLQELEQVFEVLNTWQRKYASIQSQIRQEDSPEQARRIKEANDLRLETLRIQGMRNSVEKEWLLILQRQEGEYRKAKYDLRDNPNSVNSLKQLRDQHGQELWNFWTRIRREQYERNREQMAQNDQLQVQRDEALEIEERLSSARGKAPEQVEAEIRMVRQRSEAIQLELRQAEELRKAKATGTESDLYYLRERQKIEAESLAARQRIEELQARQQEQRDPGRFSTEYSGRIDFKALAGGEEKESTGILREIRGTLYRIEQKGGLH